MSQISINKPHLRLHLTNVAGVGATQLLLSLLPALECNSKARIIYTYLPDRGQLASYRSLIGNGISKQYKRWLPNSLSRLLECLCFSHHFDGESPLLVLGDLPLRCNAPQTVFVQTTHLLRPIRFSWNINKLRYTVSRLVFRLNLRYANNYIVQTNVMKIALAASYPEIANKISVIAQPVPSWLSKTKNLRCGLHGLRDKALNLIYPAAGYPHKNHSLLSSIKPELKSWPIENLKLTLPIESNPAPNVSWIQCVGFLSPTEMIQVYSEVDGLIFLSTEESYGFPLIEAMFMGLPIVCPDLPYARALCADGAIYFDALSIDSLRNAIEMLHARLSAGWWPDWNKQLSAIPKDWDSVATAMIAVACSATISSLSE